MVSVRERADSLLVSRGLAETRSQARALIMAGLVLADGRPVAKPGENLRPEVTLTLKDREDKFVSRGGFKLEGALVDFGLRILGLKALDVGASTGGFTDCLLKHGASAVTAVDVGYGQFDWRLRGDQRVKLLEKTNARYLAPEMVDGPFDLAVIDVSFISLTLLLRPLVKLIKPAGSILALVKPQFEVGRERVGRGGVVRDPELQIEAVNRVVVAAEALGLQSRGSYPSRLKGPKGNQEHFILLTCPAADDLEYKNLHANDQ